MLTGISRFFSGLFASEPASAEPIDEPQLAVTALLVAAARSDGQYSAEEQHLIERVLMVCHGLDARSASALRQRGEEAEAEASGIFAFTNLLKQEMSPDERRKLVEAVWSVILSDNVRDPHELTLIARITDLLGLEPRDSVHARQRISERMGLD